MYTKQAFILLYLFWKKTKLRNSTIFAGLQAAAEGCPGDCWFFDACSIDNHFHDKPLLFAAGCLLHLKNFTMN
jgi:hypothetical protein